MKNASPRSGQRTARIIFDIVGFVAVIVLCWYLWPASLGGATRFVVVQGKSMEPTYNLGDAIIVKHNPRPRVGNIIVFQIPADEPGAGMMVVHRITSIRNDGSYVTQGDNRATADSFHITTDDVLGTPVRSIPRLGRLIGLLSTPTAVAFSAGVTAIMLLWPKRNEPDEPSADDDALMREAEHWLDTELAALTAESEQDRQMA